MSRHSSGHGGFLSQALTLRLLEMAFVLAELALLLFYAFPHLAA
jgi:hypothetical protein